MPAALGPFLSRYEVRHVDELGFKSLKNGELLGHARLNFDALITLDRGILHQHNHAGQALRILVVRVRDSRKETILLRVADIEQALQNLLPGQHKEI